MDISHNIYTMYKNEYEIKWHAKWLWKIVAHRHLKKYGYQQTITLRWISLSEEQTFLKSFASHLQSKRIRLAPQAQGCKTWNADINHKSVHNSR